MTGDASVLVNRKNCQDDQCTVRIADGSISKVTGISLAKISYSFILKYVLVPNLNCNLLSITKVTHDENCIAKFVHNLCEIQDLDLEMTIGNARECSGIYLLKSEDSPDKQVLQAMPGIQCQNKVVKP